MTNHDELREFGKLISSMPLSRSISEIEAAGEWIIALLDEIKELKESDKTKHQAYVARDWENATLRDEIAQLRAELAEAKKDAARYQWIRHRTSAHGRIDGYQFAFPTWMSLPAPVEAMYEVAPALDSAIDAALNEEKKS